MFIRFSTRFVILAVSALFVAGVMPILAQEPKPDGSQAPVKAPKKTYDPSRRVPDYFGQIGLTPEQRESIYKIRAKHTETIDALKKQIAEIQAAMLTECESQLTDVQKKQLEFRRANAAKTKKVPGSQAEADLKPAAKGSDH